ncbi:MAG TPA: hypothetical protein PLB55_18030 [Prosthecobacter sp.]|nr:hypothetical protein [Prosthecobacter sp.]
MKLHHLCAGPVIYCLSTALVLAAEVRNFTDSSGRVLRGELMAVSADSVTIKREDGQSFTLKAASFSAADQAYFKQAGAAAGTRTKDPPPKITPKDADFPFCATMKAVKLNPKQKDMFDELRVTTSDRIRIHGKKKEDSGKVGGKVVYHNGKLALFPPLERSGSLVSKHPPTEDVRRHFAVLETGGTLVAEELKLGENTPHAWTLTQEGVNTAPAAQVTGAGFAATARWIGNEVDLSVTFDEHSK